MSTKAAESKESFADFKAKMEIEYKKAEAWGVKEGYGLSALKVFEAGSEETTCFVANITKGGKVVGEAKNEGHGGSTWINVPKIKLSPAEYGMLETYVDKLVELQGEQKWIDRQTKSMAKKGVDFVLFYRVGGALNVIGDYGIKAEAIERSNKQFKTEPYKVVDLTATSAKTRQEADAQRNAKWRESVKAKMKAAGAKAVVFYQNDKGGLNCKGCRLPHDATVFAKTAKNGEVVLL